jgi:polyisoprenoid-binding protein YceI
MKTLTCMLSLFVFFAAQPALGAQPETWTVDPVHSTPIEKASVSLDAGSQIPSAVSAVLDASKVDTHNDMRDGDIPSAHYFNVASTPEIP